MKLRIWGTRGSVPTPRAGMAGYGGNTSCIEVRGDVDGSVLVLDAGTGIVPLGDALEESITRVDILLSHLHIDHIIGLGFFEPLLRPGLEVHLWGPSSTLQDLRSRLRRYLSPPLFPVDGLRGLPCDLTLHDVPLGGFEVPGFTVRASLVCHPGPTVGYRLQNGDGSLAYVPDHEPALGARRFPDHPRWTSGYDLMAGVDVLIHDAQYDEGEYQTHPGWGHSSIEHALELAQLAEVGCLVPFHHDPSHDDTTLDDIYKRVADRASYGFRLAPAHEGDSMLIGPC